MKKKAKQAKQERPKAAGKEKPQKKRESQPAQPVERTEEELVDLTSRVYKLVVERGREGVLQSEIWKELGLTSRDGSRLAIRLERRGLIGRVKVLEEGRWTYKLTPLRFPTDMASIEKAPCIVCQYEPKCSIEGEISPYVCPWIGPWVIQEALAARTQAPAASAVTAR
jgi:predicted DNA-binding transcriptional regulator